MQGVLVWGGGGKKLTHVRVSTSDRGQTSKTSLRRSRMPPDGFGAMVAGRYPAWSECRRSASIATGESL
jgi:hypothetical protein